MFYYYLKGPPADTWMKNLNIVGIKDNFMLDIIKNDIAMISQLNIPNFETSRQHSVTERLILESSHSTDLKLEKLLSFFTFSA